MGINKVQYGNTVLIDLTDATATADKILQGYTAYGADGSKLTGTATGGGSGDGYVWQDAQGYVHLSDEQGTQITVDSLTITSGGTYTAPTGHAYSPVTVASGSVTAPSTISGSSATVSTGTNTLTLSKTVSVTPNVTTSGYITSGTAGNSDISLTASVNTRSSSDLTASGATVTAPSGYYASSASKSVASMTLPSTTSNNEVGTMKADIFPSTADTTYLNIPAGYNSTAQHYKIRALMLDSKSVTTNGTYSAASDDLDGFSSVTVSVPTVTITQSGSNLSIV